MSLLIAYDSKVIKGNDMIYQTIYSSRSTGALDLDGIESLLTTIRLRNKQLNITGVLIYLEGVFIQVLEGDKDAVLGVLESIKRDSRHEEVTVFYEADLSGRVFDEWHMAYLDVKPEQLAGWYGLDGSVSMADILLAVNRDKDKVPEYLQHLLKAIA